MTNRHESRTVKSPICIGVKRRWDLDVQSGKSLGRCRTELIRVAWEVATGDVQSNAVPPGQICSRGFPARQTDSEFQCWPVQMFVEEVEGGLVVDAVSAPEEVDRDAVRHSDLSVQPADFGELVRHPAVAADAVVMTAFDHERSREHQIGHLGVVKCLAEVPIRHLPFDGSHERKRLISCGNFACPLVEVTTTRLSRGSR